MTTEVPWVADAMCAEVDPEIYFPDAGQVDRALAARRICRQCPVQAECLDYAITNRIDYGIWGATTAKDRQRMRPPVERPRPDRATKARATAENNSRDRAERARALRAQGSSLAAIAFALDVHERTVARYLAKDAA